MDIERIGKLENTLDKLYERLKLVREEIITHLGDEDLLHIIDFHANNWIDIVKWISSKYSKEEQMNIVIFQFHRLFKEIYWLQLLFHYGNYPLIYRNLRYILELICQAYYIDSKYHSLSLDEQIKKTIEMEETVYGWALVKTVLCDIFNSDQQYIRSNFKPLWDYLNIHVHPSGKQMDIVATEDFSSLVTDSFNENLARDALRATDEIFDVINMMLFKKFPRIKEVGLKYKFINEWEQYLPNTMKIMKSNL
jgi:hypothetical protein